MMTIHLYAIILDRRTFLTFGVFTAGKVVASKIPDWLIPRPVNTQIEMGQTPDGVDLEVIRENLVNIVVETIDGNVIEGSGGIIRDSEGNLLLASVKHVLVSDLKSVKLDAPQLGINGYYIGENAKISLNYWTDYENSRYQDPFATIQLDPVLIGNIDISELPIIAPPHALDYMYQGAWNGVVYSNGQFSLLVHDQSTSDMYQLVNPQGEFEEYVPPNFMFFESISLSGTDEEFAVCDGSSGSIAYVIIEGKFYAFGSISAVYGDIYREYDVNGNEITRCSRKVIVSCFRNVRLMQVAGYIEP